MKPLAVILHLYYQDLWDEFSSYFDNITVDFDLYVSLVKGNDTEEASSLILAKYPNAKIYVMPNRGMDVAPFIYTFDQIVKSGIKYECFAKFHSKKSLAHDFTGALGVNWRGVLVSSILGTAERFNNILEYCGNNSEYGLAQHPNWILWNDSSDWEQQYFKKKVPARYRFIGGTMFMANFGIFHKWFTEMNIFELTFDNFEDGYMSCTSLGHKMERAFGLVPEMYGKQIFKIT
jgi:hypothetical protein